MIRRLMIMILLCTVMVGCSDNGNDECGVVPISEPTGLCNEILSLSPAIPADLSMDPYAVSEGTARVMFNCLAWESFSALNWLSSESCRGTPDLRSAALSNWSDNRVWETYKQPWELFQSTNTDWNPATLRWNDPQPQGMCETSDAAEKILVTDGVSFEGGLVLADQIGNITWYEVRFNKDVFDYLKDSGYAETGRYTYSGPIDSQEISFPTPSTGASGAGSIVVKGAWKEITDSDDRARYYTQDLIQYDSDESTCTTVEMGLVGFHIMRKLDNTPNWIWMTFEQEDNVPPFGSLGDGRSYNYFSEECAIEEPDDCWTQGSINSSEYECCPNITNVLSDIIQVTRLHPVREDPSIAESYRKLFEEAGSPFQYFILVGVQWAVPNSADEAAWERPCNPTGTWEVPLPEEGQACYTAIPDRLRNTTMEWEVVQTNTMAIQESTDSCLSCHDVGGRNASFLWYDAMFNLYPLSTTDSE